MSLIGPVQAEKSEMAAASQQQERMRGEKGLQNETQWKIPFLYETASADKQFFVPT